MENPLELPAPPLDEPMRRIEAFARDLAYGAVSGLWTSRISANDRVSFVTDNEIFTNKWKDSAPSVYMLLSFGFLIRDDLPPEPKSPDEFQAFLPIYKSNYFLVSAKAFALLEKPATPPSVFISYKQTESSDLALLIEARLKLVDRDINIFIDKLLQPGDDWEKRLEETVRNSRYFICLLTSDSLMSKAIQNEIQWAYEANCTMIAVCHNGYDINEQYPSQLRGKQAIIIRHKNAKEYESAIGDLLNSMGYSTI